MTSVGKDKTTLLKNIIIHIHMYYHCHEHGWWSCSKVHLKSKGKNFIECILSLCIKLKLKRSKYISQYVDRYTVKQRTHLQQIHGLWWIRYFHQRLILMGNNLTLTLEWFDKNGEWFSVLFTCKQTTVAITDFNVILITFNLP